MTVCTIGIDGAWGGLGWAVGTESGPVYAGHFTAGSKTWRQVALRSGLEEIEHAVADVETLLGEHDLGPRVVVERPPWQYSRSGSQVKTAYGLGTVVGGVLFWGTREGWAYPWEVPPSTTTTPGGREVVGWRSHWRITIKGRDPKKIAAVRLVQANGWGRFFGALDTTWPGKDKPWPAGDLAEAILIQVFGARRADLAPRGPRVARRARNG